MVLPGCCLALPGFSSFWSSFLYGPKISAFLKLKFMYSQVFFHPNVAGVESHFVSFLKLHYNFHLLLGKNQFPPRDVTWAHACSRYLFTWPTLWAERKKVAENSIKYFYPSCGSKARTALAPPLPLVNCLQAV